jgi:3-phosphoshikimate 1-carboxyvinyltransferase
MLRDFGVSLKSEGHTVRLHGGQTLTPPAGGIVRIPGDFSSAAFPLVAAGILPGSDVRLRGVGVNPTRTGLWDVFTEMGASLALDTARGATSPGEPVADLIVRSNDGLRATEISGDTVVRSIDEFPVLAVAATQADGVTVIRDAAELRLKESDRIASVAGELRKLGAQVEEQTDGMTISGPARLRGAVVECHRDHRLAMALAVAGLAAEGETVIRGAEAIGDSFPGFVETMRALGADIRWR